MSSFCGITPASISRMLPVPRSSGWHDDVETVWEARRCRPLELAMARPRSTKRSQTRLSRERPASGVRVQVVAIAATRESKTVSASGSTAPRAISRRAAAGRPRPSFTRKHGTQGLTHGRIQGVLRIAFLGLGKRRPPAHPATVLALGALLGAVVTGCGASGGTAGPTDATTGAGGEAGDSDGAASEATTPAPDTGAGTTATVADASPEADAGAPDGASGDSSSAQSEPTDSGASEPDVATEAPEQDAGASSDPQPASCDGGGVPPSVAGTASCPSDKNLEGCPCAAVDASAACWRGHRANRGAGSCRDGTTTCTSAGVWGPCSGEVLPISGGTGPAACECFSTGSWSVSNLEPCFLTAPDGMGNMVTSAYASTPGNPVTCAFDTSTGAPSVPAAWSTDTLTVDCSGEYALCLTLKAGDPHNPQPTDCILGQSCTAAAHYGPARTALSFPPLPGWSSTPADGGCATQFVNSGGYGEMSVAGQTDECEAVGRVFQTVSYCPPSCSAPNPPSVCGSCKNGGGGPF